MTKATYPTFAAPKTVPVIANGQFVPGNLYRCISVNPKAKPGIDGKPRFTVDGVYMCVANATSVTETSGRPPVFLVDNGFRCVNAGADAKMKTQFIDA